jgi:hypothetical protein
MLTWEGVTKDLRRQFPEDIVQDVLEAYFRRHNTIQHGIRYFRVMAKRARLAKLPSKLQLPPEPQAIGMPPQLARVLLSEVWDFLPDKMRKDLIGRTSVGSSEPSPGSRSSASRVRRCRLKKKLARSPAGM